MRILYVLPDLPGLEDLATGYLRHVKLVEGLSRRHDVSLLATVARVDGEASAPFVRSLEQLLLFPSHANGASSVAGESARAAGRRTVRGALLKRGARRRALGRMRATLARLAVEEPFDVMIADFQSIRAIPRLPSAPPLVLDVCDAATSRLRGSLRFASPKQLPERLLRYAETARWQRRILKRTPHLVFISSRDRDLARAPLASSLVIPNGVDTDFWRRAPDAPLVGPAAPTRLVFHGVMSYPPNLDAAIHLIHEVLPRVRATHPGVGLTIVGRDPPPPLREAARHAEAVEVTGLVPDVRAWLQASDVYVAPLRFASGMQNKLLEAMAMELPAVTTSVAAEGCRPDCGPAPPLVVADGPDALARATASLLDDRAERLRLAREGRCHVVRHCSWQHSVCLLESLCARVAAPRAEARRWMAVSA